MNKSGLWLKAAIAAHRRKGTPHAVEQVVKAILNDAVVQEWFEYGGGSISFSSDQNKRSGHSGDVSAT